MDSVVVERVIYQLKENFANSSFLQLDFNQTSLGSSALMVLLIIELINNRPAEGSLLYFPSEKLFIKGLNRAGFQFNLFYCYGNTANNYVKI